MVNVFKDRPHKEKYLTKENIVMEDSDRTVQELRDLMIKHDEWERERIKGSERMLEQQNEALNSLISSTTALVEIQRTNTSKEGINTTIIKWLVIAVVMASLTGKALDIIWNIFKLGTP